MKLALIIFLLLISQMLLGQSMQVENSIRTGNEYYKQQKYEQAKLAYEEALKIDPSNSKASFNLANTLCKQEKLEEAASLFTKIISLPLEKELKAITYYNKAVTLGQQKELEESIAAYKNSLRLNSNDKEARENLQKALLELKKKKADQKENEQDKKKKQQQSQKPQSKLSQKEAEQKLKLLEQKEKEVQQRLQKEKGKAGGSQAKDW